MIVDTPFQTTSVALTLDARAEAEAEERATLEAMKPRVLPELEDTIDVELLALQRLLDVSRFRRLMSITPQEFGLLDQVERRLLLRAAEGFHKRFDELRSWMGRNCSTAPEVPAFLQAKG